jgi:hypothetical protein
MDDARPKYRWPWVLLIFFLLFCALAVVWMLVEVKRTQRIRDLNSPPPAVTTTNKN